MFPDYIWEENYAAAVRYHRENGDLNVPSNYVDDEGIRLGQWVCGLRSNRNGTAKNVKPLTDEQIARLDAIGMRWGSKYDRCISRSDCHSCTEYLPHPAADCPRELPGKKRACLKPLTRQAPH